jgi:dienelactone hydrolase
MKFLTFPLSALVSFTAQLSFAQEPIKFEAMVDGSSRMVNAIYSLPAQPLKPKSPAVVIMHSTGGDRDGTTQPLVKALNDNGFVTLQIQLFSNPMSAPRFENTNAVYFNALKYLSQREEVDGNKVGIAGYSYGAFASLFTATQWVTQTYGSGLKFAAHAPIYPGSCWMFTQWAKGETTPIRKLPYPPTFAKTWTGAPVKIFAAGKDDYDDRDPNACPEFVAAIAPEFRSSFEWLVYPDATHGWNQQSSSFFVRGACKNKGCTNNNVNNPEVSTKNNEDVVRFFLSSLADK